MKANVSDGYTNISMVLGWHFTGIAWDKDIRMRSFDLVDMRALDPTFITFFDGKSHNHDRYLKFLTQSDICSIIRGVGTVMRYFYCKWAI